MLSVFVRRVLVAALAIALTAIVAVPPAAGYTAVTAAPTPPDVALDSTPQTIGFSPPWTGSVGDAITLSASSASGLPVSFSSTDAAICLLDGATLTFAAVGTCVVTASQAGDATTWDPAPDVAVAIQVSLGFNLIGTASRDGVLRTDDAIQIGDELALEITALDTAVEACSFRILTAGGWMMLGAGAAQADGSCSLSTVIPEPSDAAGRAASYGRENLDLCVYVETKTFADGSTRVLATPDRTAPGGFKCYNGFDRSERQDEVLDFTFDGTGTPIAFSSSPKILSWNIADWDPSYVPLQFNTGWNVAFPAWVSTCQGPYLNGDWTTVYHLANVGAGCPEWSLRLPGVLPATMPWGGGPASWTVEFVIAYTNDVGTFGETITTQQVPYQPSDGEFESSFPAISPTDLAVDRFVHVGETWQPTFRISGVAEATSCSLHLYSPAVGQVVNYVGSLDGTGLGCAFTVPAFADEWAYSQYYVSFGNTGISDGQVTYAASITAILPPAPPTIPDPTANLDGTTTVAADAGAGQGMSLEMSLVPDMTDAPLVTSQGPRTMRMTAGATSLCSAVSYTSALSSGGDLAPASSDCALAPGDYVVTARMVDATGAVTTSNRTITILMSQTITFNALSAKTYGDPGLTVSATASSGLAVTFSSTTPSVCSATSGGDVSILARGTCTIRADQAGDGTYAAAAAVQRNFVVGARAVTVTADAGQTKALGALDPTLSYHVTSGSLVAGDVFAGALSRAAGESAGAYPISRGTLTLGGNYNLTFVGDTFVIDAGAVIGSSYVPIPPVRVLDSRSGVGLSGVFVANKPRTFQVAGVLGIPANAIAVTGNVTIVKQTAGGFLSVTPTAVANPLSSTINFPLGDTRANNLTIPLASNGKLAAVYKAPAGKTTHVIVDITGYFLPGDQHATYTPIDPARVLDTRLGASIGLSGTFAANLPRKLVIAGTHAIPADAVGITGNLTVVGQTRAGYLSITKVSDSMPGTSTLNFPLGDTRANGVSVPLNATGSLWIVYKASAGTANVVLDVTGYYRDDPSGLLFYPLTPSRVMDTRPGVVLSGLSGSFAANVPRRLEVAGQWAVPAGANAIVGNLTVVNQTAAGYVSATLQSVVNPTTSVLNFPLGDARANGVILPLNSAGRSWFVYKPTAGGTTHLILDLFGYFN